MGKGKKTKKAAEAALFAAAVALAAKEKQKKRKATVSTSVAKQAAQCSSFCDVSVPVSNSARSRRDGKKSGTQLGESLKIDGWQKYIGLKSGSSQMLTAEEELEHSWKAEQIKAKHRGWCYKFEEGKCRFGSNCYKGHRTFEEQTFCLPASTTSSAHSTSSAPSKIPTLVSFPTLSRVEGCESVGGYSGQGRGFARVVVGRKPSLQPDPICPPATLPVSAPAPSVPFPDELREKGVSKSAVDTLSDNEITTMEHLFACTEQDLKDIGIKLGSRKALLAMIKSSKEGATTSLVSTPSPVKRPVPDFYPEQDWKISKGEQRVYNQWHYV